MAANPVLRILRSDEEGGYVLARAASAGSGSGSKPLNLKLYATEGEYPFVLSLRQSHVVKLKDETSPLSAIEWEQMLISLLVNCKLPEGVEVLARVNTDPEDPEKSELILTFRKRIQEIAQRLGVLTLSCEPDEPISVFEWCDSAAEGRDKALKDLTAATARIRELEGAVGELKRHLEQLLQAKEDDESVLLEKFRDLLNEKKVKIREQQRLLESAHVDPQLVAKAVRTQQKAGAASGHVPRMSRPAKRKQAQRAAASGEDDSDDGFEKMEVDAEQQVAEPENRETSDEEATESEDDEEELVPSDGQKNNSQTSSTMAKSSQGRQSSKPSEGLAPVPPQRQLPFGLGRSKPNPSLPQGGSDTESDDEL